MALFDALGFRWDRSAVPTCVPAHSLERVCFRFHKMLPEFVWDASVLEGNPFTFPEVKTLLDGVTVGGHKVSDQEQILNLAESSKRLLAMVKSGQFELTKPVFTELNGIVARKEALEWGVFRGEGQEKNYTPDVGLGEHGRYTPLPTLSGAPELNRVFREGVVALQACEPFERATAFFLFGALQQFFFDGNKRTSRFMMNGVPRHRRHQRACREGAGVQREDGALLSLEGCHGDDDLPCRLPPGCRSDLASAR